MANEYQRELESQIETMEQELVDQREEHEKLTAQLVGAMSADAIRQDFIDKAAIALFASNYQEGAYYAAVDEGASLWAAREEQRKLHEELKANG